MKKYFLILSAVYFLLGCGPPEKFDLIIRGGTIYDGTGGQPFVADVAINADTITRIGKLRRAFGEVEMNASGLAVSPGFINMLSWATESLIEDGRGMSDIMQGVTLEVMGEGWSMGPLTEDLKVLIESQQGDIRYPIQWTTLGQYLEFLERKGISPNVASFVGATTLRIHQIGNEDRAPTEEELENMRSLAREAMEEGAMGIGSSLIYAPAFYAETEELIELCKVTAEYGGMYITHLRSEGNRFLEAIDEVVRISHESGIASEIYHLKAAGQNNWHKMDLAIAKIDSAREAGINITTDMYTYTAGATGLDASMPPWVQEGGYDEWAARLQDPEIRTRVRAEMKTDAQDWENLYFSAGSPDNLLLVGFKNDELKKYTGKSLSEVAEIMGKSPEDAAMELVVQDGSRVGTVYFLMSEENIKKQLVLDHLSFGSDAGAPAAEGVFLKSNTHPRAYGNFARLLGKYVRDEKVLTLEEAIRKLTSLPASNLKIEDRGILKEGFFADIALFEPDSIQDHATFEDPHQYATGMKYVFVNGELVLNDGVHTGATPGRFVRGPGFTGN